MKVADIHVSLFQDLALGTRGLTSAERTLLDEQGFVVVPGVLAAAELVDLVDEFERIMRDDPDSRGNELGTRRSHADRDNEVLAILWRHRLILEAAAHCLGDHFQVGGADLRDPSPGQGEQRLHPDHGRRPSRVSWERLRWSMDLLMNRLWPEE